MKKSDLKQSIQETISKSIIKEERTLMKNASPEARQRDIDQSDIEYNQTLQKRNKVAQEMFGKNYKELDWKERQEWNKLPKIYETQPGSIELKKNTSDSDIKNYTDKGFDVKLSETKDPKLQKAKIMVNKIVDAIWDMDISADNKTELLDYIKEKLKTDPKFKSNLQNKLNEGASEDITNMVLNILSDGDPDYSSSFKVIKAQDFKKLAEKIVYILNDKGVLSISKMENINEAKPQLNEGWNENLNESEILNIITNTIDMCVPIEDTLGAKQAADKVFYYLTEENHFNIIKNTQENLNERQVFKTAEFEIITSAINDIEENLFVFNNPTIEDKVSKCTNIIKKLVEQNGFENIDEAKSDEDEPEKPDTWNKADNDDSGVDDEEAIDKTATKGAKKVQSKAAKLDFVIKNLRQVTSDITELVNKWKKATTDEEKQPLIAQLKEKNKLKKELEELQELYSDTLVKEEDNKLKGNYDDGIYTYDHLLPNGVGDDATDSQLQKLMNYAEQDLIILNSKGYEYEIGKDSMNLPYIDTLIKENEIEEASFPGRASNGKLKNIDKALQVIYPYMSKGDQALKDKTFHAYYRFYNDGDFNSLPFPFLKTLGMPEEEISRMKSIKSDNSQDIQYSFKPGRNSDQRRKHFYASQRNNQDRYAPFLEKGLELIMKYFINKYKSVYREHQSEVMDAIKGENINELFARDGDRPGNSDLDKSNTFAGRMDDLEEDLQEKDNAMWLRWEKATGKYWEQIEVSDWAEAWRKDREKCEHYSNKLEELVEEENIDDSEIREETGLHKDNMSNIIKHRNQEGKYSSNIKDYTFNELKDLVDESNPPKGHEDDEDAIAAEEALVEMGFYDEMGGGIVANNPEKTKDGKTLEDLDAWFEKNRT